MGKLRSNIHILALILVVLSILAIIFAPRPLPEVSRDDESNPAAVYCVKLGYRYEIRTKPDGSQYGVCVLPDGTKCDAWDFFNGKCGQKYTYCERNGGKIVTTNVGCRFSPECGVCILPDGTKCYEWDYFTGKCP